MTVLHSPRTSFAAGLPIVVAVLSMVGLFVGGPCLGSASLGGTLLAAEPTAAARMEETKPCPAATCPPPSCVEPDVWVVNTRCLPRICHPVVDGDFLVERRDSPGCWSRSSVEELAATDRPVVLFIHGNRYDPSSAKKQGVALAQRLHGCRPDAAPVRLVVFSWPSESNGPPLREARDNFARAESDGHYLGAVLAKFSPENDLGIISYSFGAKIALIGLEDLLAFDPGRVSSRPGHLGLVLVTPAIRVDSLSPCGRHHAAVTSVDRLTIFTNPSDEALRFFPFVDPSGGQAAGYVGVPRRWVPGHVAVSQVDASPIIGKEHSMQSFIDSWKLSCRIAAGAIE